MDKILQVKKLKVSFRTVNGTVKAVRDISFDLERGETLAIVGESGSGKSVTSKAILGILAGNAIIEGGEILYDGKDLLKVGEDDMHKIRGDKISMIFQDPLSSLDPIVKIGKQITEAMLLKNKANRRAGRKEFNTMLARLKVFMDEAVGKENPETIARIKELVETFDKFNISALKLENSYNIAHTRAEELYADIEDLLFRTEHKQKADIRAKLIVFSKKLAAVRDPFLTAKYEDRLSEIALRLKEESDRFKEKWNAVQSVRRLITGEEVKREVPETTVALLSELKDLLREICEQTKPNFFRIGFYQYKNPGSAPEQMEVEELNEKALAYLNENFMNEFLALVIRGVQRSYENSLALKREVPEKIGALREYFLAGSPEKKETRRRCAEFSALVERSIDRLSVNKDSIAYTFSNSLKNAVERYFFYCKNNPKEEARYERQTKRRDALIAKGKNVDWKVVPKVVMDLGEQIRNIVAILDRLEEKYAADVAQADAFDGRTRSVELIDFFKDKASQVVYRVTKRMAREKAIKLMDEVGIPEPRIRYYQYPFEFSGGMRQRIVIAIALAANPDILICDEPTTALDVTIQAQILELINKLKEERNLSVIFITHDLGVVANMADKIAVMYAGKIVEYGTADDIFYDPRHPYTWALLSSMPDLDTNEKLDAIPGTPPNMIYPPVGDAFAERNKYALQIDFEQQPPMFEVSPTHYAATWLLHPDAPKVPIPKTITDRIKRMKKLGGAEHGKQ